MPASATWPRLPLMVALVLSWLLAHSSSAEAQGLATNILRWRPLPALANHAGLIGSFAGVSGDALIVAGGARFKQTVPGQKNIKQWDDTIYLLDDPDGSWQVAGQLPRPLGHGLSVSTRQGVICAGGQDGDQHVDTVFLLEWVDGLLQTTPLPPLPRPCAFLGGAVLGDILYVAGGLETPDAASTLKTFWALDLSADPLCWQVLEPWPGPERMMAVCCVQNDSFYLISGIRLKPAPRRKVVREYLTDAYRYQPSQGWQKITPLPRPAALAPALALPMAGREQLIVLGGDDGSRTAFAPLPKLARSRPAQLEPAFSQQILLYDAILDAWTVQGQLPFSLVAGPQVSWRGYTVVSGTAPGESSAEPGPAQLWAGELVQPSSTLGWMDGCTIGGALLALSFLLYSFMAARGKRQATEVLSSLAPPPSLVYAWLLVGLLWVVAVLNYVDRQIVYSVFPLLQAELHLSNVELGLISSIFLWVYGLLSPFAGFLADRYGRKRIIVASLLVWSLVTWLTGQVTNFLELLGTRALMGVSEACYLPAALALIVSFHGPRSRSLASGLHHSGLYVGVVLGGVGGSWLGERYGWRWAFLVLGSLGVLYVLVLMLVLREPKPETDAPAGERDGVRAPWLLGFAQAIEELLALPGFIKMLLVFSTIATVNCVIYTWLPLYLYETFRMNLTAAGFSATFYIQAASLIGILLGGWLADRWSGRTERGRLRTQMLGLLVAAPCLMIVGLTTSVEVLCVALIMFGLGRGFYDCNVMPVLSQIARSDLQATGYGVFNLAGCLTGGGVALLAGVLKETVGLGRAFQFTGLCLLCMSFLLGRIALSPQCRPTETPAAP